MQENKMGAMPVPRLLLSMAWPLMLSLLVQALYSLVDGMYVAHLSETALTATSLAFPVQMFMISLAVGTGVGTNTLLSRLLGQKRFDEVGHASVTGFLLAVISSATFALIGGFLAGPISRLLSGGGAEAGMCEVYLRICLVFSAGNFLGIMVQRFLQASGKTMLSMIALMSGAIVNIVLDPLLIFGLLGFPRLGVAGAAAATVIGQWLGAAVGLILNRTRNPEVPLRWQGYRMRAETVATIYKVGLPVFLTNGMASIMNFAMNAVLLDHSTTAVAFFGVYFKLQNFLFMPVNGLGQASIPIISYNYGAKNGSRIRQTLRVSLTAGAGFALCGSAIFILLARQILLLFAAGPELLAIGVPGIRIIAVTFALATATSLIGSAVSALGNAVINMCATLMRQIVILVPLSWALLRTFGIGRMWYAFWIAESAALLFSIVCLRREYVKKVTPLLGETAAI